MEWMQLDVETRKALAHLSSIVEARLECETVEDADVLDDLIERPSDLMDDAMRARANHGK